MTNTAAVGIYSCDSVGRVHDFWQCTPYKCTNGSANPKTWNTHYSYDLAGDISAWTHPAGFTVTNAWNTAQQIAQILSSLSDSTHPATLAAGSEWLHPVHAVGCG